MSFGSRLAPGSPPGANLKPFLRGEGFRQTAASLGRAITNLIELVTFSKRTVVFSESLALSASIPVFFVQKDPLGSIFVPKQIS